MAAGSIIVQETYLFVTVVHKSTVYNEAEFHD